MSMLRKSAILVTAINAGIGPSVFAAAFVKGYGEGWIVRVPSDVAEIVNLESGRIFRQQREGGGRFFFDCHSQVIFFASLKLTVRKAARNRLNFVPMNQTHAIDMGTQVAAWKLGVDHGEAYLKENGQSLDREHLQSYAETICPESEDKKREVWKTGYCRGFGEGIRRGLAK